MPNYHMFGKDSKDKKDSSTKATKKSNIDFTNIRTKLGLTEHAPEDKIAFELNKLKQESDMKKKIWLQADDLIYVHESAF